MDHSSTELQELTLQDGTTVFFEVNSNGGREEVGILDAMPFSEVTTAISGLGKSVAESVRAIGPDKFQIEIGMEFAIKNGHLVAIVARGSAKANFKLTMEWTSDK